jgi:hypothetical protein
MQTVLDKMKAGHVLKSSATIDGGAWLVNPKIAGAYDSLHSNTVSALFSRGLIQMEPGGSRFPIITYVLTAQGKA